ncbi:MAG: hypothetical protein AAFX76_11455, partial [Planctomycetota bacterium]
MTDPSPRLSPTSARVGTTDELAAPGESAKPRRRSYVAGVVYQTIGRRGAAIGAVWLGVIAFFAVFAPLLANSHPIVWKLEGQGVSSPLLRHLSPADVTLLVMTVLLLPGL